MSNTLIRRTSTLSATMVVELKGQDDGTPAVAVCGADEAQALLSSASVGDHGRAPKTPSDAWCADETAASELALDAAIDLLLLELQQAEVKTQTKTQPQTLESKLSRSAASHHLAHGHTDNNVATAQTSILKVPRSVATRDLASQHADDNVATVTPAKSRLVRSKGMRRISLPERAQGKSGRSLASFFASYSGPVPIIIIPSRSPVPRKTKNYPSTLAQPGCLFPFIPPPILSRPMCSRTTACVTPARPLVF